MSISTHVLDTARGRPAAGMPVTLARRAADGSWHELGQAQTDPDGRVRELFSGVLVPATYRLRFDTQTYFSAQCATAFYPEVMIMFCVTTTEHQHVPLLLSPFGYTTYRGS